MDILGEVAEYLKFPHLEKAAQMALCKPPPPPGTRLLCGREREQCFLAF